MRRMLIPADPDAYAAAIAPVVDAVHIHVHAAAHSDLGMLNDLRFTLPLRALTRRDLAAVYRYAGENELEDGIREHVRRGDLADEGDALRLTDQGFDLVRGLYDSHAAATARIWRDRDLGPLAALAERVLGKATAEPGDALAAMAPPYEPEGSPAGLLLFNRLAALRYARADAHAAAWQEAGLTAAEVVALEPGPLRTRVEAGTNRRAAVPYHALSRAEREFLYRGLLDLV